MLEKGKMNKLIIKESQGTEIHEILFYVSYLYRIERVRYHCKTFLRLLKFSKFL